MDGADCVEWGLAMRRSAREGRTEGDEPGFSVILDTSNDRSDRLVVRRPERKGFAVDGEKRD